MGAPVGCLVKVEFSGAEEARARQGGLLQVWNDQKLFGCSNEVGSYDSAQKLGSQSVVSAVRPKRRGYIIAVLAAALSVITLGYLALAGFATRQEDDVEKRLVVSQAYYAAESGLVEAECLLLKRGPESPPSGSWLKGQFPAGRSEFRVDVLTEGREKKKFQVRSIGRSEGEGLKGQTVEFGAQYVFRAGKGWTAVWRGRL